MTDDPKVLVALLKDACEVRNVMWQEEPHPSTHGQQDISKAKHLYGSAEPGRRIYELANLWLIIAAEEIRGVGVLIEERRSWPAMFPLIRANIEHCGAVLWLTDKDASLETRAARAATAMLDGRERELGVAAKIAPGSPEHGAAKQRLGELIKQIESESGPVGHNPWSVQGERMIGPTKCAALIGERTGNPAEWTGIYGYLCGMGVHPGLAFGGALRPNGPGQAQIVMSDHYLERFIGACVHPFLMALGAVASSMGWERALFDDYHRRCATVVGPPMDPLTR